MSTATAFLALGVMFVLMSMEHPRKWAENALWVLMLGSTVLPLFGYDPRFPWDFLEESAIIACLCLLTFSLARYAKRQLSEGEYDRTSER